MRAQRRTRSDKGSAVLAAVFVSACAALLAAQVTATSRSTIVAANGALAHARMAAEAQGGVASAVAQIQSGVWDLGRAPRTLQGSPDPMTVVVEDERGKAPLNTLTEAQARALFQAAGVDGSDLDGLVQAFLDYRDPNRVRTGSTPGASGRAGGFASIAELRLVPGVTPNLYAALAPSVTVSAGDRAFDPANSTPLAVGVMTGAGVGSPAAIEAQRELEGQRPALSLASPAELAGRTLTIRVTVEAPDGGRYQGAWLVELTGRAERPYVVMGRAD